MPGYPEAPFPDRPFISCNPDALVVVDQSDMAALLRGREVDHWIRLEVGPGNAVDSAPVKVLEHSGPRARVQCSEGVLEIDFAEETIRKTLYDGAAFVYRGSLDSANDGAGWMAVR